MISPWVVIILSIVMLAAVFFCGYHEGKLSGIRAGRKALAEFVLNSIRRE